VEPGAGGTYR